MANSRPSRPESLIGCTVADRYLIESAIGDGGMATVYRANQIHLRRPVALKVLKSRFCDQPDSVERFVREARAASAIRSPYVVDILDVGEITGTTVFIAMELLEGPTLERLLLQEGKMRWSRACRLALQIVSGLRAVHEHGIVHRDIKPSNCMVVRGDRGQEHVKILDFGIAKLSLSASEHELTQTGAIFGTAKYMSPEQSRGQKVDARTDIYAFGVILYEMLAGRVPFEGDNFAQVATRHVKEPPPPLHHLGLPPGVEALVMRCLAKTPQERFTSMRELESSLMALTGGHQPPKASPRSTLTEGTVVLKDGGLPADYARQSRPAPGQRPPTDAARARAQHQTGRHDQAGRHAQPQTGGRHAQHQTGRQAQQQTGRHDQAQAGRHSQHPTGRHAQAGPQNAASLPGGAVPQRTLLIGNNTAAPAQSDAKLPPRSSGKSGGKPMPAPKSAKSSKPAKAAPPKTMVMAIAAAAVVFVGGFSWWYVQGATPSHADLIAQAQQISQASLVPAGSGQDADEAIAAAAKQAAAIQEAALAQQAAALEQAGSPEQAKAIKEAFAAQQAVAAQMAKAAQQQMDQAQGALTDQQAELIKQAQAQQAQVIAQAQAAQKAALEQAQKAAQQHAQAVQQEQPQAQADEAQAETEQAQAEAPAQIAQPAAAPPAPEPEPKRTRAEPAPEPRAAAAPVGRQDAFEPSHDPERAPEPKEQEPERAPEPKEQAPPQAPANDAGDEPKKAEDKPSDSDRGSKGRRSRRHDRSPSPGVQRLTALTPKDIEQSLRVARRLIRSKCGGPGLRLSIRMELEILPSGKLISGRALPPFDRSEVGACAERYVRLARFPQRDRQDSTFVVESFKLGRNRR